MVIISSFHANGSTAEIVDLTLSLEIHSGSEMDQITYHHIMINGERFRIVAHKYVIIALIRE